MNTIVTLTPDNAAGLAWAVELTGLSLEEIVNNLVADELTCFRPDHYDVYVENTLGCWKFKDRASAERTGCSALVAYGTESRRSRSKVLGYLD
jgi:hypothetical protein